MKVAAGSLALLATLVATVAAPAPARADGLYFSEGFGGTRFDNELGAWTDGAFRIRAALGFRADRIAIEGFLSADTQVDHADTQEPELFSYGLDVKYNVPISRLWEVYVRGSASRMTVTTSQLEDYGGRGLGVGTGLQVKGKAPLAGLLYPPLLIACVVSDVCKRGKLGPRGTIAAYIDQGYDFYRLHDPRGARGSIDVEATRWTIGFAIGSDF